MKSNSSFAFYYMYKLDSICRMRIFDMPESQGSYKIRQENVYPWFLNQALYQNHLALIKNTIQWALLPTHWIRILENGSWYSFYLSPMLEPLFSGYCVPYFLVLHPLVEHIIQQLPEKRCMRRILKI